MEKKITTVHLELSEISLVDKPNTKINILYGRFPEDIGKPINTDKPQCKICCATASTKTSNTMNLYFYLRQKHLQLHAELMKTGECSSSSLLTSKASSKTVKDLFEVWTKLGSSLHEHKELTKSITYFLVKDMLPAYTYSQKVCI